MKNILTSPSTQEFAEIENFHFQQVSKKLTNQDMKNLASFIFT